ncbi:MAG TPA: hypothetical protein VGL46_21300 [Pseudonocardiaceae bacterium]
MVPGERRKPVWPPGVVGSLTHCTGYRAAAVAHRRGVLTVGIDAEPHEPLPQMSLVPLPSTRSWLGSPN